MWWWAHKLLRASQQTGPLVLPVATVMGHLSRPPLPGLSTSMAGWGWARHAAPSPSSPPAHTMPHGPPAGTGCLIWYPLTNDPKEMFKNPSHNSPRAALMFEGAAFPVAGNGGGSGNQKAREAGEAPGVSGGEASPLALKSLSHGLAFQKPWQGLHPIDQGCCTHLPSLDCCLSTQACSSLSPSLTVSHPSDPLPPK